MLLPHEEIFILTTGVLAVLARYVLGVSPRDETEKMRQRNQEASPHTRNAEHRGPARLPPCLLEGNAPGAGALQSSALPLCWWQPRHSPSET